MTTYATPGVYYERVDEDRSSVNPLRTDIAAFVGIAQRGPLHEPVAVTTWEQFQSTLGSFIPQGYLAYCVKAFFENGGARCHVVRVAAGVVSTSTSGAAQPADGSSSIILSTAGFVQGAVVTVRRDGTHAEDHVLADVNTAGSELIWQIPLSASFIGVPLTLETGAAAASAALLDATGTPTLRVEGNSPGTWGNGLSVEAAHQSSAATRTRNAIQPASRQALYVASVTGFASGTLIKLFQQSAGPAVVEYRVIDSVEPGLRMIGWPTALSAAFDLTQSITVESVAFSITVRLAGKVLELFTELSLVPDSPQYVQTVVNAASRQIVVTDLKSASPEPQNLPDPAASNLVLGSLALSGGRDGLAALDMLDFCGTPSDDPKRGIRTLEDVDEVSIVAVPDILIQPAPATAYLPPVVVPPDPCALCPTPPGPAAPPPPPLQETSPTFSLDEIYYVQEALVDHCERMRYRIALLDPPWFSAAGESRELQEIQAWRQRFDSSHAALYFPWVLVYDPLRLAGSPVRVIPPGGHVAGTYARADLTVGVHRAPANFSLNWIQALLWEVSPTEQGLLNPQGINCLRTFPGRGLRVYAARTVSSDPSWRYVNVRRLMMMIEKACEYALQWAVFEPNNAMLRIRVSTALNVFLESLFQAGAFAGDKAEQSFFVKCDASNNPPDLTDAGQFLAQVGVAPAIPAEFIVFRVGRTQDRLEVTE